MLVARLGLFLIAYPLILGALWWLQGDSPEVGFFALFAFFGVQIATQDLLAAVYTARQRMSTSALFQAAMPVSILVFVGLLVIPKPTLPRLAFAFILGAAVITVTWTWLVWKQEKPLVRLREAGTIMRGCLHYGISGLVWNAYLRIGVLVLTFVSGAAQVAIFAAAFKLIDLIFKVAVLANRVVAPRLYADSQHRPENFRSGAEMLLRMTVATSTVGALGLYVAGSWIVTFIYGANFAASGELIRWLGISLTLKTIALIAQTIISAAEDHTHRTRVIAFASLIGIVLTTVLAIRWGAAGATYAVVASDVILLALLMWRIQRTRSITRLGPVFLTPLLAAIACGTVVSYLSLNAVLEAIIALTTFVAILFASGYLAPVMSTIVGRRTSS